MTSTRTFSIITTVGVLLILLGLLATPAPARQVDRARCGLSKVGGMYLMPITQRKRISCRKAKRVASGALERWGGDQGLFCNGRLSYGEWWVIPDYYPGLGARFTKPTGGEPQRFRFSSQGSC